MIILQIIWGFFNPPGVGQYDKDPDDKIPFYGLITAVGFIEYMISLNNPLILQTENADNGEYPPKVDLP